MLSTGPSSTAAEPGNHLLFTVTVRWAAVLVGGMLVWRSTGTPSTVIAGLPIAAFACLRSVEARGTHLRPGWVSVVSLVIEVAAAAAVVAATGGWHSGWAAALVIEVGLFGYALPVRLAGQIASGAVIAMFLANLASRGLLSSELRSSLNLDALMAVAAMAVSYATWLGRYGDAYRASLARANQRLMATNDLLTLLEQTVLRGEDTTDPQQAARAVARLARKLFAPQVVVVASVASVGDTWRILLAEGVTLGVMVDDFEVLRRVRADATAGNSRPTWIHPGRELISSESSTGVCIPLLVRGRLIGALILESTSPHPWRDPELETMSEISPWAALLVDNACRFHALWVVGSAEERARVARNLHDSLGQRIAALGLQLDWISRVTRDAESVTHIRGLRAEVRSIVAELRYTMRDLRCDVSADCSLSDALRQLVESIAARAGTEIKLEVDSDTRLPLGEEYQLLQMARTLLGAAVDSSAKSVGVKWKTDPDGASLEIGYDRGWSTPGDDAAPGGQYDRDAPILTAVAEVRDRCWAVGATLECEMERDKCNVRCKIAA